MLLSVGEREIIRRSKAQGAWEGCGAVEVSVIQEVEKAEVIEGRSQTTDRKLQKCCLK